MDIVLVAPQFAPHFEGGTESVVRAQGRELARRGHRVRVVAGTDRLHGGEDVEHAEVEGLEVAFLPRMPEEHYDLALARPRLRPLVRELVRGADVVHAHHWWTLHASIARDCAADAAVVLTLHDLFTTCARFFRLPLDPGIVCPPRGERGPCVRCLAPDAPGASDEQIQAELAGREAWLAGELDAARALVVPSASQAGRLAELLGVDRARFRVVPHGLSDPLERVVASGWSGAGPLRVLFLGHRSDVKGVGELVRGAAALPADARARLELVLLGDEVVSGFDDELRAAAGDVHLVLAGNYALGDLAVRLAELGGAHLGAFPSRAWESYGLVPDELMALGLPVWVSDRGAPRERVGAAGRVLPAGDAGAWTRSLAEVLADPSILERERRALPERARTAADAAAELEALYSEILSA